MDPWEGKGLSHWLTVLERRLLIVHVLVTALQQSVLVLFNPLIQSLYFREFHSS